MARRRTEDDDVSLFPFLSILACIIGVLTLLISALALAQMDSEVVVAAEQYEKVEEDLKSAEQEAADLQKQIETEKQKVANQANEKQKQLADARKRLEQIQAQIEEARKAESKKTNVKIPKVDKAAHKQRLEEMQTELKELLEKIAQLEKSLKERKLPPKESEVSILPGGSGLDFDPHFVECSAGALVLHIGPKPVRVRLADMQANKEFLTLLDKVAASPKATLVFLVRSDALSVYRRARDFANSKEVRNGKLPVVGKGRIDLSYFRKKKK